MKLEDLETGKIYDIGEVPREQLDPYVEVLEGMIARVERRGNRAEDLQQLIESMLASMEQYVVEEASSMSAESAMKFSCAMMMVTAAIRTVFHNPLYESEALSLQLRHHVNEMLSSCGARVMDPKK